jgi:hypothetical protein
VPCRATRTHTQVGDKPGASKQRSAAEWGIRMLSEENFFAEVDRLVLQKQGYQLS